MRCATLQKVNTNHHACAIVTNAYECKLNDRSRAATKQNCDAALQALAATQIATATLGISRLNQFCPSNSSQFQPQEPRSSEHSLLLVLLLVHSKKLHCWLPSNWLLRMSHGNRIDQLIRIGVLDIIVGKLLLGDAVTVHLVATNCSLLPPAQIDPASSCLLERSCAAPCV